MELFFTNFDDAFFYVVLTVIFLLGVADFLIGKTQQQKMREGLETFWLHLEENTYHGLAKEDAAKALKILRVTFGKAFLSQKFVSMSFVISVLITLALLLWRISFSPPSFKITNWDYFVVIWANFGTFWMSLMISMILLHLMSTWKPSFYRLVAVIAVDIIIALFLSFIALYFMMFAFQSVEFGSSIGGAITDEPDVGNKSYFVLVVIMTGNVPTLFHLVITSVFIFSKLFRPLIQTPISIVVLRVTESPKGPLTLFALGVGATAKLIQQWFKYFDSLPIN